MMQLELKKLQKKLGLTFIYVTHDQDEALTMSDRIIIIEKGKIQQDDTPQNIYKNPNTKFTADFIGESNLIKGTVSKINNNTVIINTEDNIKFTIDKNENDKLNEKINIMIRPENIKISRNQLKDAVKGIITDMVYDGSFTKFYVKIFDKLTLKVMVYGDSDYKLNEDVYVKINDEGVVPIREN
jgi:spermidine/putrescine transport system ATP-binding protein